MGLAFFLYLNIKNNIEIVESKESKEIIKSKRNTTKKMSKLPFSVCKKMSLDIIGNISRVGKMLARDYRSIGGSRSEKLFTIPHKLSIITINILDPALWDSSNGDYNILDYYGDLCNGKYINGYIESKMLKIFSCSIDNSFDTEFSTRPDIKLKAYLYGDEKLENDISFLHKFIYHDKLGCWLEHHTFIGRDDDAIDSEGNITILDFRGYF